MIEKNQTFAHIVIEDVYIYTKRPRRVRTRPIRIFRLMSGDSVQMVS